MTVAMDRSRARHPSTGAAARRNRLAPLEPMAQAGWERRPYEWWHYNLPGPERYPLLDDSNAIMRPT